MPNTHRLLALLPALLLSGCVRDAERGPFAGDCAEYPSGIYQWGDPGIGSCLAGPVDLRFIDKGDGRTWLAVANANPYRNFSTGSVLMIPWDDIDFSDERVLMSDLHATSLPTDPFIGGLDVIENRRLLLTTGRLSEKAGVSSGSAVRAARDDLWVVDIGDDVPRLWAEGEQLTLEDDPQPIVIDNDNDRAYVLNLTDHSVSVIDTTTTPLQVIDVADSPRLGSATFTDLDGSGSSATLADLQVVEAEQLRNDLWTLTWIEGSYRLWVPTDGGLARYANGGDDALHAAAFGVELDPNNSLGISNIADPTLALVEGLPLIYFADTGAIKVASSQGTAGSWAFNLTPVLRPSDSGWARWLGGPTIALLNEAPVLFFDARPAEGEPASIGVALQNEDGSFLRQPDPVLSAPEGSSYAQPYVLSDPLTNGLRMWFSVWDGDRWSIALSESFNGLDWSEPEIVYDPAESVAAPVVGYAAGRYIMWYTHNPTGLGWVHARAWSWDGRNWQHDVDLLDSPNPFNPDHPPRVAVQADLSTAWRVEGRDAGVLPNLAGAGLPYAVLGAGFTFVPSSGQLVDNTVLDHGAATLGLLPGSTITLDGRPTLYVTGTSIDERQQIGILEQRAGQWRSRRTNLIPAGHGGNVGGVSSPLVFELDGSYELYYAATNRAGITRIHRATSSNGLDFTPIDGIVLPTEETFDAVSQLPHSVQFDDDGTVRIWFAGFDGSRNRIAAAIRQPDGTLLLDRGPGSSPFQLGTGEPGDFDDSGVRDPMWVQDDDGTHIYYSGFDGTSWHLGRATQRRSGQWERVLHPVTEQPLPVLTGVPGTFSSGGVISPVLLGVGPEGYEMLFGGLSGSVIRLGYATGVDVLYPHMRFPTVGDTLQLATRRGDDRVSVIELAQTVNDFTVVGEGGASLTLDPERGFLYVASKLSSFIYVIDIRDDSGGDFLDANYLDLEAVLRVASVTGALGFRSLLPVPGSNLMYATSRGPDGIVILDLSSVVDDDIKQVHDQVVLGQLPMRDVLVNEGVSTSAGVTGGELLLAPDGRTLLATHLRGNAVYAYDLGRGAFGAQTALIPTGGENPYAMALSPDGKYAVVANYVGDVDEFDTSSTLAVIDLDPSSPTYLEVVTWLVNR